MNRSEKSQEKTDKTEPKKALNLEELDNVNGGEFMAIKYDCSDRGTHICTGNPYQCKSSDENKRLCTFG